MLDDGGSQGAVNSLSAGQSHLHHLSPFTTSFRQDSIESLDRTMHVCASAKACLVHIGVIPCKFWPPILCFTGREPLVLSFNWPIPSWTAVSASERPGNVGSLAADLGTAPYPEYAAARHQPLIDSRPVSDSIPLFREPSWQC